MHRAWCASLVSTGLLLCLSVALPAAAVTLSAPGQRVEIAFDGRVEGEVVPALAARATFEVVELAEGRLVLDVSLRNLADAELFETAQGSALGFDVGPALTSAQVEEGALFEDAARDSLLPGRGVVDVCLGAAGACDGDAFAGVGLGEEAGLRLLLVFREGVVEVEIGGFALRWTDLTAPALGLLDAEGLGEGRTVAEAPLALLLLGLAVGLGALEGRERARSVRRPGRRSRPADASDGAPPHAS